MDSEPMCEKPQSELENALSSNRDSITELESIIQNLYERTESIRQPIPVEDGNESENTKTAGEPNLVERIQKGTNRINYSKEKLQRMLQELVL